jgi:tetraspanin-3
MCKCTSKIVIAAVSIFFVVCAILLLLVGGYMFLQYHEDNSIQYSKNILVPASIIIGVGLCLLIMAFSGFIGACKEQKCLLGVFSTFLLLVVAGSITASAMTFVYRKDIDKQMQSVFHDALEKYGNDSGVTKEVDDIQTMFHCCGIQNYTDWDNTPYGHSNHTLHYPDSCCPGKNCTGTNQFENGCYNLVHEQVMTHLGIVAGVISGFLILLILALIFSFVLICQRRSEIPYIGLAEPGAVRA